MEPYQEPGGPSPTPDATGDLAVEWEHLQRSVFQAFGLAKAGASSRGYLVLHWEQAQAVAALPDNDPQKDELFRSWDAALCWFERYAPPPLGVGLPYPLSEARAFASAARSRTVPVP